MQVTCDKCKQDFELELKTSKSGDIETTYFICPHCNDKYIAGYTNEEIRRLQAEMVKLRERSIKAGRDKDRKKFNKFEKRYYEYKRLVSQKMDELKKMQG